MNKVSTREFVDHLIKNLGICEFCGVSDSTLGPLIDEISAEGIYTSFTNEGDAVAYAAGRTIGGVNTAVLMQNSGLTNASSPISSLTSLYNIPLVYIVGYRGQEGVSDEPQHKIVGKNTVKLINDITDYRNHIFYSHEAFRETRNLNFPLFYLFSKGELTPNRESSVGLDFKEGNYLDRLECIKTVKKYQNLSEDKVLVLSTTGYTSRELMSLRENDSTNFYMLGSMGCLSSFASGVAQSCFDKKFIVLDGDGSYLMRPEGTYVTNLLPVDNVLHIIFNNGTHLSTGGQLIPDIYLKELVSATSCYSKVVEVDDFDKFDEIVKEWITRPLVNSSRLTLIVKTTNRVNDNLPRPKSKPEEILGRFVEELFR